MHIYNFSFLFLFLSISCFGMELSQDSKYEKSISLIFSFIQGICEAHPNGMLTYPHYKDPSISYSDSIANAHLSLDSFLTFSFCEKTINKTIHMTIPESEKRNYHIAIREYNKFRFGIDGPNEEEKLNRGMLYANFLSVKFNPDMAQVASKINASCLKSFGFHLNLNP